MIHFLVCKLGKIEKLIDNLWSSIEGKNNVIETKKTLFQHYTALQHSQAVRLVGFVTGLFTLLGLTKVADNLRFSQIFSNFPTIILLDDSPQVWDFLKVTFLFIGVSILMFFILRTIFRFSVFGNMNSKVATVTSENLRQVVRDYATDEKTVQECEEKILWVCEMATSRLAKITKIYWFLPASLFLHHKDKDSKYTCNTTIGHLFLIGLSVFISSTLILFFW